MMSIWESIKVALDNLRVNKLRSFLTMIGIVFGVAAVVTVVSIGQAGQASIMSIVTSYKDGFFVIYPDMTAGAGQSNGDFRLRDLPEIRKLEGVRYASLSDSYYMTTRYKKNQLKFTVTATTAESFKMQNIQLVAGRFFTVQEERARQKVIVVDQHYAEKVFGSPDQALQRKVAMSEGTFQIVGVYKPPKNILSGMSGEQYTGYAPISAVFSSADGENQRFEVLEIMAASQETMNDTIKRVKKWLTQQKGVPADFYRTETGLEAQESVAQTFGILQTIIGSIAGVSLLVGGIGVMNIMLVSVTERTREIGIRKAIGATPGAILIQFMIEAVVLSFVGGMVGASLGLLFAYVFAVIMDWPFIVSAWAIMLSFGFSAAVGIFFGLYPARKASRLNPIESLRYE